MLMSENSWETWAEAAGEGLPAAVLDLDAAEKNIELLARQAGNKPLRLVTKSLRCRPLIAHMLAYLGDRCSGLMAFHPEEAAWLSEQFRSSILVAYPSTQVHALSTALAAVRQGADITFMVDSADHLTALTQAMRGNPVTVPVAIDLDMSSRWPGLHFGVQRSPIRRQEDLAALLDEIRKRPGFRLAGVMGYEAQIAGLPDLRPDDRLHSLAVPRLKTLSRRHVARWRAEAVRVIRDAGFSPEFVNGGGTGSVAFTAGCPEVTEIAVGSGVFCPHLFDHYRDLPLRPAAGFVLPVDRRPQPGVVTCSGGGYVASGACDASRLPKPVWPEGVSLLPLEGAGEVQTPVRLPAADLSPDRVVFRHAKAGELCERFNQLRVHRSGKVVAGWPTYRGEGRSFI